MKYPSFKIFLLSVGLVSFLSCQKEQDDQMSETSALDQVLGITDTDPRHCGLSQGESNASEELIARKNSFLKDAEGKETSLFIDSGSSSLKEFTAGILVSIPKSVLVQVFNVRQQGQIVLDSQKVKEFCGDSTYGCAIKKPKEPLKIYIMQKKSVIGLKLLQIFAQAMSHNIRAVQTSMNSLSLTSTDQEAAKVFQQELQSFVNLRQNLLSEFEKDIQNVKTKESDIFRNLPLQERTDYVFSHVVDSVYCSTKSMDQFQKFRDSGVFRNTFNAFFGVNAQNQKSLYAIIGPPWYQGISTP